MHRRSFLAVGLGAAASAAFARPGELVAMSLQQASELVRARAASPVELTRACLEQIEKYQPLLNAFITVTGGQALEEARLREQELVSGQWRGPLHGIPIALKDNIDTAGVRTTAASALFQHRVPAEDAEVVRRLKRAGAVFLGKLNLHEFAGGGTSAVTYFGPVHNPWNPALTPGGSSGGAGAAVAAGLCYAAVGTDTAGSVRIPASYCGITGLKPTYGRASVRGVIPLSWSLDHIGPMCRTAQDTALMLQAMAGYDAQDPAASDVPVPDYARALTGSVASLRLGLPRTPFFEDLDPDVARAVDGALAVLGTLTAGTVEVKLPPAADGPILEAEAYSYHARWLRKSPERYQPSLRAALRRSAKIKTEPYARAL
ncbi:MAG TPA: amidase, partial [Bryobacteraceae bacterium]|nr:amidase [Bryobacteraceae bacterium]